MTDWKKAYSTWLATITGVLGALLMAVQSLEKSDLVVPTWVLPVLTAAIVFARALPQDPK